MGNCRKRETIAKITKKRIETKVCSQNYNISKWEHVKTTNPEDWQKIFPKKIRKNMRLEIVTCVWSDHEDERGDSCDIETRYAPLEQGIVDICKYFYVDKIMEDSVMIAKKDGSSVSLGTYSTPPTDLHAEGFGAPELLKPGGDGITVSSSSTYNGNSSGYSHTVYLVED